VTRPQRVGICTGGGDAPGLNAVIRGFVKAGRRAHGLELFGIADGLGGLIGPTPHIEPLDFAQVRGLLPMGGTILGTTNRGNPFRYPVRDPQTGVVTEQDIADEIVSNARRFGLDGVVMVGGDGTMEIGRRLMARGLPVFGVPKTIDNDLSATEATFGFDTAVGVATEALDRLHTTAASHDRVMLLEVMGRHAGFIALQAGIAGGADFIVLPEVPYDVNALLEAIGRRRLGGSHFAVGVVAEGALPRGGAQSVLAVQTAGANPRLMGAAYRLEQALLDAGCPLEVRTTVLGHTQRGGTPSPFDRVLATRYGVEAAACVADGQWGRMVRLRAGLIETVTLEEALATHRVDPDGQVVRHAEALGISFGR